MQRKSEFFTSRRFVSKRPSGQPNARMDLNQDRAKNIATLSNRKYLKF